MAPSSQDQEPPGNPARFNQGLAPLLAQAAWPLSPRTFLTWLDGFAFQVEAGRPTAAQWVEVLATLASVDRSTTDPRELQITFLPDGAVRTDEFRLRTRT